MMRSITYRLLNREGTMSRYEYIKKITRQTRRVGAGARCSYLCK